MLSNFKDQGFRVGPYIALLLTVFWIFPLEARSANAVFVVNSDDDFSDEVCDARHCNLREALTAAEKAMRGAEIRFELPTFPYRIELRHALPALRGAVILNGGSQPGTECPLPLVQIDGSSIEADVAVDGLQVLGDGNRIRGFVITGFSGNGILVEGNENELQCLFIGVDPSGTQAEGNGGHGIAVVGGHSNRIGGPGSVDGNLLSANAGLGIYTEDALNTYLAYNGIGVDLFGEPRLSNGNALLRINPPPEPANARNEKAIAARIKAAERRIAHITEKHARALEDARLFEKYLHLSGLSSAANPPANLSELVTALAEQRGLFGAFTAEAAAILAGARYEAAVELDRLGKAVRRSVPAFGRELHKGRLFDVQAHTLSVFSPNDYVVSGPPSDIVALESHDEPPTQQHLWWHSLTTYGPQTFEQEYGTTQAATSKYPSLITKTCVSAVISPLLPACYWPVAYDLMPWSVQLTWQSPSLTQQEIEAIVTENGYHLELWVNGKQLNSGPPPEADDLKFIEYIHDNLLPDYGYYSASLPGRRSPEACPVGRTCLVTTVLAQNVLAQMPPPWNFEIKVKQLEELDIPVVVGIDELGNKIVATHGGTTIAQASRTVMPNQETNGQLWFTEALFETFKHPRCTDCHGFGTFEKLAEHHTSNDIQEWIDGVELHLEPSLYVPGAHVMACNNCHQLPLKDHQVKPFIETEWIAPYQDLNVNWAQQNAAQICARVKINLPFQYLRFNHFHGDARLFWAIQNPDVSGFVTDLDPAPPYDWAEFLRRVDLWNDFGAPCP